MIGLMVRILSVVVFLLAAGPAAAQPGEALQPPPHAEPTADLRPQYDAAFEAMLRGDLPTASAGFRAVAAATSDPELRGAASQLARLADTLASRGARLTFDDAAPGMPAPVTGVVTRSEDDEPDAGRASFVVSTTIAALYSGVVLIDLADIGDLRAGTLVVMGSTTAGLLGSLYGSRGRTMTGGMADAWSLGLAVGAGNALLLSGPLGLYEASSNASEKVQTFVLGTTWGLAAAGLVAADRIRPTRAQVNVVGTFGMMGLASTLLSLAMVQPDELSGDAFLTITAVGLDAGLAAGVGFAGTLDWSLSRARLVGLSAFLGALAGGGTSLLLFAESGNSNSARLSAGITLAGLWGGFGLGMHLSRNMAPDHRFRARSSTSALLAPTIIHDAPGVAVLGSF